MFPSRSSVIFTFRVITYFNKNFAYTVRFTSFYTWMMIYANPIIRTLPLNDLTPISMKHVQVVRGGILDCLCCSINLHTHHFSILR